MAECKFMRQDDDEKYCTMFLAKCDSKELEFCCDDNCTVRDMAEENERLKAQKDKYYQQTLDDEIQVNELYQEIERLKADNERIENNFIQQLEYEKQALDYAIKYKTCLQEIKAVVCSNGEIIDTQGRKDILKLINKAEEE